MILARNFRSSLTTFGDHSFRNFCEFGKQIKASKFEIQISQFWISKLRIWLRDFATRCPCCLLIALHTVYLKTSGKGQIWKIRNLILNFEIHIFNYASDGSVLFQKRWKQCMETSPWTADLSRNDFSREMILPWNFGEQFRKVREMILTPEMILPREW